MACTPPHTVASNDIWSNLLFTMYADQASSKDDANFVFNSGVVSDGEMQAILHRHQIVVELDGIEPTT